MAFVTFYDALGAGGYVRAGTFDAYSDDFVSDGNERLSVHDHDTDMITGTAEGGMIFYGAFIDDIGMQYVYELDSVIFSDNVTGAYLADFYDLNIRFDVRDDFSAGVRYVNLYSSDDEFNGNRFGDYIEAGAGRDTLIGNAGNDTLLGQSGGDVLRGGTGNDRVNGGTGKDTLAGGAGADRFIFKAAKDTGNTATSGDIITDFVRGSDRIDVAAIDAFTATASRNDAFTFVGTSGFSSRSSGEISYAMFDASGTSNDYTLVYIDTDRDTAHEAVIRLTGLVRLTASDFIL